MLDRITKIINNKLFKDSFVYVFADIINKAIPFLLLPVLTHYLTPEDYGKLASFTSFIGIIGIFIGMSAQGAITVNYYKLNKIELSKYIGNIINILLITFIISLLIIYLFQYILVFRIGISLSWLFIAALMAFASYITTVNLSLWLVEQKPKKYSSFQIFQTIITLSVSLFFVIIFSMSWEGRVFGMLIGGGVASVISMILLIKRGYLIFNINKNYLKDAIYFGTPLIPHQLSFWLRSGAIIFILSYIVGDRETGLYNIGAQFVIPLSVLAAAFNKAWTPYLYRKLSAIPSNDDKRKIVKFTYLYFFLILFLALILSILSPYIIGIMLDVNFYNAYKYTVILSFSAAFQGMYFMVVNYIFYIKKNKYIAYTTFSISIINVILAYILINKNGSMGAVQAKLFTSFLNFIMIWYFSNKLYKMPWTLKR